MKAKSPHAPKTTFVHTIFYFKTINKVAIIRRIETAIATAASTLTNMENGCTYVV